MTWKKGRGTLGPLAPLLAVGGLPPRLLANNRRMAWRST
jgi:hypothetical protein